MFCSFFSTRFRYMVQNRNVRCDLKAVGLSAMRYHPTVLPFCLSSAELDGSHQLTTSCLRQEC